MCNDTEKWQKIWGELTCRFKTDIRNLTNLDSSTRKSQKNLHFNGLLLTKVIMIQLKKYRWVIIHSTKEWCKIGRKTDLWFRKWHEEFGMFSPEHLQVSKLGLWWDPFVQSWKCACLKFTVELCVMTMKNDVKFEKELTCKFKIDLRNLANFDLSTGKSQNLHFNGLLLTKVYNVWA